MKTIKHFSFDLWFTLIKSNIDFKKERAKYFHEKFNSSNKSILEIENIFRSVDLMCNSINEKTGCNISSEEMYLMVIYQINDNNKNYFSNIDLSELYSKMEQLFFNYSPTVFCNQTINVLDSIKQNQTTTTNILSNTAFIKGLSLRKLVNNLGIEQYFDFQIYSDEVNFSKPNIKIYDLLINEIHTLRKTSKIALKEILHIGDNPIADIRGAELKGLKTFQINTNQSTILNLIN
jgi:putative hydrolase of the HAD superfamily